MNNIYYLIIRRIYIFKYIIKPCDTIFSIAQNFGLDYKQIILVNPQVNNQLIFVGQILNIPGFIYKVRSQDTLNKISQKFDIPLNLLLSLNPQIKLKGNVSVGQRIFITNKKTSEEIPKQAFEIESNSNSIMDDIDKEDWNTAQNKLNLIKNDFNDLKPILHSNSVPINLIDIIDNAITSLETEINLKNVHKAKVQAFIISEYFRDTLDILIRSNQNK